MPIRRAAATPPQDKASSPAADGEPDAASEEPSSNEEASPAEEAQGDAAANGEAEASPGEAPPGAKDGAGEKDAAAEKDAADAGKKGLKDGFKLEKAKVKKVKRTIPAWATVAAGKKMPVSNYAGTQPKVDDILIEAIKSNDKSGISYKSVMKYIVEKYPSLELHKRKFLIKKALKKQIEKGTIKQLKGKGLSGSFAIGKKSKAKAPTKKIVTSTGVKSESLGDAMPLIITRLCEPKEASYILIKKYVEQHFPHLNVENRPDLLKAALVRAVERGQLERITGKGASGTFQLKRTADKTLTKGGPLEDAITVAITAMNEPKTCSMATLRKHLIDKNKDSTEARVVALLRKTLTKCKMLGWMEQITGNGFNGTYQLSFPYYPSPAILYPDRVIAPPKKKLEVTKRRRTAHSSDEEEEEEEEESEEEEEEEEESSEDDEPPPPKKRLQKRPPPKVRRPVPAKKPRRTAKSKARGKKPAAPSKTPPTPAKKPVTPAKKPAAATAAAKKATPATPVKATPVKRAAPAKRLKTPAVKKLTTRGPAPKKSPSKKAEAKTEVKAELSTRKSLRGRN